MKSSVVETTVDGGDGGGKAAPAAAVESSAAAPSTQQLPLPLPHGWERAWDAQHEAYYYYNAALGVSQWEMPTTSSSGAGGGGAGDEAAAGPADDDDDEGERQYCYRGPDGRLLGPFTPADLWKWRPHLPMDLQVWCMRSCDGGGCSGGAAHGAEVQSQALADVLGDAALLAAWRAEAAACWPAPPAADGAAPTAPPAPVWEAWQARRAAAVAAGLTGAALAAVAGDSGDDGRGAARSSSFAEYAAAALAGLPPTDDAVVLAKTALHYGRPLDQALTAAAAATTAAAAGSGEGGGACGGPGSSSGGVEYARDPRTGRLTAAYGGGKNGDGDGGAARLYGDLGRWAKPAALEAALAARQQKRSAGGSAGPVPEGGWARHNAVREAAKKRAKFADV